MSSRNNDVRLFMIPISAVPLRAAVAVRADEST